MAHRLDAPMLKNLLNRILSAAPVVPAASVASAAATAAELASAPAAAPLATPGDVMRADALIVQGNEREDAGDPARAEALYRDAVAAAPGHARAYLNLGIVLAARHDHEGAIAAYEQVLAIEPSNPFGNYNYACLAVLRRDFARAGILIDEALRAKPDFAQALVVKAEVLEARDQLEPAIEALRAALRLRPDDAGAWFNLGSMLRKENRHEEAQEAASRALQGQPDNLAALELLCRTLRDQGLAEEALVPSQKGSRIDPTAWVMRSMELMHMNFVDGVSADDMYRRHVEFGADLERIVPVRFERHRERGDPQRRLRVAYFSSDFYLHPVSFFLLPVMQQHDRSQVEVFCYSFAPKEDATTGQLRAAADHWRDVAALSDTEVADLMHADGIDVLVDLMGHTGYPRPGVFAQRPAPVQVAWLGYLNTTGLTRMDFRISDARCDPLEIAQRFHTERLVHMPASQWCYRALTEHEVEPVAPFVRQGHLTFGSFNAGFKVTAAACRRWAQVMLRVPDSRLLFVDVQAERKQAAIRRELTSQGIADDRIEFVGRVPLRLYLELYHRVDITFDSFPYGGGTTTFDSLWMGAPVLATVGETSVSRSAASILTALGLEDWIAPSVDEFVELAVARASDREALLAVRGGLRARLSDSLLTELPRYTRDLEAAYRSMWLEKTS
jgi:predicted O-linked N-acetylglucosamine transferase (SPINDLY family)